MTDKCELCGNNADMNFNCILPRGDKNYWVKGLICLDCYGNAYDDTILAIKIIKHRDDINPGYKQTFINKNEIKTGE